jgi:hypothetical protein
MTTSGSAGELLVPMDANEVIVGRDLRNGDLEKRDNLMTISQTHRGRIWLRDQYDGLLSAYSII